MSKGSALFLAYDTDAPSFRHRMRSLFAELAERGWKVTEEELPRGRYLLRIWERRHILDRAEVIVVSKINFSALEAALLARYGHRIVFDFDDAIYVRKPRTHLDIPGESVLRRAKFLATCRIADRVVAGNSSLADAARPTAKRLAVMPTTVNLRAYEHRVHRVQDGRFTVVWIGRPENLIYLELVRPALARLKQRKAALRLRVVCSEFPDWREMEIERIPWSTDAEVPALMSADVGIMPLTDDAWTRGKCAFKLLQYMAASLPCVASPVGANLQAVHDGITGFMAEGDSAWEQALQRLMDSAELRARFGAAGRVLAEERYCDRRYAKNYADLLGELA